MEDALDYGVSDVGGFGTVAPDGAVVVVEALGVVTVVEATGVTVVVVAVVVVVVLGAVVVVVDVVCAGAVVAVGSFLETRSAVGAAVEDFAVVLVAGRVREMADGAGACATMGPLALFDTADWEVAARGTAVRV